MPKKDPTLLLRTFFCTLVRRVVDVVSIRKMDDSAKSVREIVHLMRKPLIINGFLRREGDSNPRNALGVYTLSRRASSTTRASFLIDSHAVRTVRALKSCTKLVLSFYNSVVTQQILNFFKEHPCHIFIRPSCYFSLINTVALGKCAHHFNNESTLIALPTMRDGRHIRAVCLKNNTV